jgi:hypothetical protein
VTTMIYRKPEIVTLGEACHTIQQGHCVYEQSGKSTPFTDGTSATGCSGSPISGLNSVAAYDLDE